MNCILPLGRKACFHSGCVNTGQKMEKQEHLYISFMVHVVMFKVKPVSSH